MVFRIRYTVRGDWTLVDVIRVDGSDEDRPGARGHVMFRTYEWNLLYTKLRFKGPIGLAGERELTIP